MVEGHGEVEAIPLLVRRVAADLGRLVRTPLTIRVPRSKLLREGELERTCDLVRRRLGIDTRVLVTFDADDDCHVELARLMRRRAHDAGTRRVAVVVATRELEAWFLAGVESLRGRRGIRDDAEAPESVETYRDAKGRLARLMTRAYSEVTDPPAFAAALDFDAARRRARSFDKFLRDVTHLLSDE